MSRTGGAIDTERSVVTALREISFELREGDRLGLMGHNGAGKSTMLRLLSGAYPPTRGRITSVGRISTLFNTTPGLNPDGTGRENLYSFGLHMGLSRRKILAKMEEIIDFAELGDYIDLPVRIYSSGMMTRLGFSIATAVEPEILLLDEGLATGDAQFAQKAQKKLNDLIERSSILVIASHSEALLASMCNRCLLLEHGRVVSDGPAQTLLETYRASVIEAAQADDAASLHRAYVLATEMARRGERPPLELEEQGLRYALTIAPDDAGMWQRYVSVLAAQKKPVPPQIETRMILNVLANDPSRTDLTDRLRIILAGNSGELPDELRERAASAVELTGV
ncbi:ABC transporter ATP-binding protein [Bradyrhizobium sp. dw_411]|uniref:ABC transporter ATP-binding protein n=1 Tax=Bradyrhizobium sp. dw_411 TaxID=2720082 RepID=UPI001BCB4E00|nr:ABC transporter ATP-binding protein [Bradyrhizobium sp. dw_411]